MRSGFRALVLVVASFTAGCGDDIKFPEPDPPDPVLNAVIPAEGFSGRTLRVQVSGDSTLFTDAATISFGAGTTVANVQLASTGDLIADVTIAPDAAAGLRDVTVTDGGVTLTLTQAFEVQSPIEIIPQGGDPQQGGFAFVAIVNHDVANPFPLDPTLITLGTTGTGTSGFISDNDSFTAFATLLFDTDATSGAISVTYNFGSTQVMSLGNQVTVTARTATALTPDVKGTDLVANATFATASGLFSFNTTALVFGDVFDDLTNANAFPDLIFLPGGKWANARFRNFGGDQDRFPAIGNMFVLALDLGATGYGYEVRIHEYADLTGVAQVNEAEPNDTSATAQTVSAIGLFNGDITNPADVDFVKVSATTGQTIRVITTSGGFTGQTDTEVTIFDTNGSTILAGPTDADFAEDVTSPPIVTAGDYFVSVNQSFFCGFFVICDRYEAVVLVENLASVAAPQQTNRPAFDASSSTARLLLRRP